MASRSLHRGTGGQALPVAPADLNPDLEEIANQKQ
jgi:hypothetical protein